MKDRNVALLEISTAEAQDILNRVQPAVGEQDFKTIKAAFDTVDVLTHEIAKKRTSIGRLRALLFGSKTEKTKGILERLRKPKDGSEAPARPESGGQPSGATEPGGEAGREKRKGHGRNGARDYEGATWIEVPHESLKPGDRCPDAGCEGKVYRDPDGRTLLRIVAAPPVQATVYHLEQLRCHLCGTLFTARSPEGVGEEKYDESVSAMVGCMRYGSGFPFNRLEKLQDNLGVPLPAATQWGLVKKASEESLRTVYGELIDQAAQGQIVHNDDTKMKVLELMAKLRPTEDPDEEQPDPGGRKRTGMFTSAVVAQCGEHRIALFFTGRSHAGENLETVLAQRAAEHPPPIHMCDGLDRNNPGECPVVSSSCTAHARRRFVDVAESFPDECRHVLEILREVYHNDAVARERGMSPEERLRFHQEKSAALMEGLRQWMKEQLDTKKVEPNSGLGEAMGYMLKRWDKLTLFLRQAGAVLDNNIAERALKKAILHRKGSLFYKTLNGARVGDIFMSLIHTAELAQVNALEYLTELLRHRVRVREDPSQWLPWNYKETLKSIPDQGSAE